MIRLIGRDHAALADTNPICYGLVSLMAALKCHLWVNSSVTCIPTFLRLLNSRVL
jgi:hypothetical protein